MQSWLRSHGIDCSVRYLWHGSLQGCWRLCRRYIGGEPKPEQRWTIELADRLVRLGFVGFDSKPLGQYSGNGGLFSVFVRGHYEFLYPPPEVSTRAMEEHARYVLTGTKYNEWNN